MAGTYPASGLDEPAINRGWVQAARQFYRVFSAAARSPLSDHAKLSGGRDRHVYVITPDNFRRSLHFDDFALERPWLGVPSDLPPHGDRDDHRQHLVTAAFARRESKENRLAVAHPAVTDCAVD